MTTLSSPLPDSADVAIVGAGPVGAMLACLLGKSGLSVLLLDRERALFDKPRAIVLDHEALRVLQFCGVNADFFKSVSPHTGTDFVGIDGGLIKLFDPSPPPFQLGWPPNVMFIQPELENALADAMANLPTISTRRGWNVHGVRQDGSRVVLDVTDDRGGAKTLSAAWVVGADGANSFVRQAMGATLQDMDFAEWWVVVDAWLTGAADLPKKTTQYCQPERPATYVVGPRNLRRWEIKLLPGEDPDAFRHPDRVKQLMTRFVDVDALELWRTAVYRFRAVVADRWRSGRLLIAGDAAHTMPPFLAQGLCAGVRDVVNLSWRLRQVVQHGADADLLDGYEAERKPHVSEVIAHAKEFGLIIGELDAERGAARDEALRAELTSGRMKTERQAFIPNLRRGLIDAHALAAGALFVQPHIETANGANALFDDVVGPEFLIISASPAHLALDAATEAKWNAMGGRRLLLSNTYRHERGVESLIETDGLIAAWLQRLEATAVIVRPDRYVYGAAASADDVARMARDIVNALHVSAAEENSA